MNPRWIFAIGVLVLFVCTMPSHAQWSTDPTVNNAICTATNGQAYPTIGSDGAGGAIITWEDSRSGYSDIYAQRINALGAVQWTADGVAICTATNNQYAPTIVSDGAGGAIITWFDTDIYAQRINASGAVQWTADGVAICTATSSQSGPNIANDGTGGFIIAWTDHRSRYYNDIYAQRINASGVAQWTANGVPICVATDYQEIPTLVSDGAGGAIIIWRDHRNGYNYKTYAQRIGASGEWKWTFNGVAISTAFGDQDRSTILSDGAGGAIIAWDGSYGIYAQRINASGTVQWTADGVAICTAANLQGGAEIVSDSAGGAIITWIDHRSGNYDIYAQRMNASGVVQWTADGVAICTATDSQVGAEIVSDGAGGAIITWQDGRSGYGNTDIYAQRINASGVVQWTADGVAISTATNSQGLPTIVSDGAGGAIIAWQDSRNGKADIYAQRVRSDGTLGGNSAPLADAGGPYNVNEGGSVTVTALGSDPENGPLAYAWDLDNNGSFETPGQSVIFSAADLDGTSTSSRSIQVQVTDNGGLTATDQATVNVLNVAPIASFANLSGTITAGQSATLAFSNQADPSAADVTAGFLYSYDYTNDGTFEASDATAASYSCAYPMSGTFTAKGRIKDKDGDFTDYTVEVTVIPANLALNKAAIASSSRPGHPPEEAVDGSTGTHWRSDVLSSTTKAWLEVDLGARYTIDKVTIDWSGTFYAKQYEFQIWKNSLSTWQTVYTDNAGDGGVDNIAFAPVVARHVRILMTKHNETIERINEFEVYAAAGMLAKASEGASDQAPVVSYQLEQNYPNPFNPNTTIQFSVLESGVVQLSVYNINGQEVRTLVSGPMNAGRHTINWDGKANAGQTVPSGVYLYKLHSNGFAQIRKMTFMK